MGLRFTKGVGVGVGEKGVTGRGVGGGVDGGGGGGVGLHPEKTTSPHSIAMLMNLCITSITSWAGALVQHWAKIFAGRKPLSC